MFWSTTPARLQSKPGPCGREADAEQYQRGGFGCGCRRELRRREIVDVQEGVRPVKLPYDVHEAVAGFTVYTASSLARNIVPDRSKANRPPNGRPRHVSVPTALAEPTPVLIVTRRRAFARTPDPR